MRVLNPKGDRGSVLDQRYGVPKTVLLTVENLNELAGSKQWVRIVANEMVRSFDCEVTVAVRGACTGPMRGETWLKGIDIVSMNDLPKTMFDFAMLTPHAVGSQLMDTRCAKKIVNVVHGCVPEEAPIFGCDGYIFISEEAKRYWMAGRNFRYMNIVSDAEILLNPVDLSAYEMPNSLYQESVRHITHFSNYSELPGLREFCEKRGIGFTRLKHQPMHVVKEVLAETDLVFGIGRCAYEAMYNGCEVVFADNCNYNKVGPLSDGRASINYQKAQKANCSGRVRREKVDETVYARYVDGHNPFAASTNRRNITLCHDSIYVVSKIFYSFFPLDFPSGSEVGR